MTLSRLSVFGALLAGLLTTSVVRADDLAALATKKTLTSTEEAEIAVKVTRRVTRLQGADTPEDRAKASGEIVDTAKIPGASQRFLAKYAEVCADKLSGLMSDANREIALQAVLILAELDRPEVIEGYVAALSSPHLAVRYRAAKGIRTLHKKLKGASAIQSALSALGDEGAGESNPLVLREIYRAVDFSTDVSDFKHANEAATALTKIFEARKKSLDASPKEHMADLPGFQAASRVSRSAGAPQRKQLARAIHGLLAHAVDRAYDAQEGGVAKANLTTVAKEAEKCIRQILKDSNVNGVPPELKLAQPPDKAREVLLQLDNSINQIP